MSEAARHSLCWSVRSETTLATARVRERNRIPACNAIELERQKAVAGLEFEGRHGKVPGAAASIGLAAVVE